uniref:Putative catalytically inactive chitinase-like lectin n=1 Tax=Ixodes ricinus TaxID=34613 RepID=A0A131Y8W2_IXORI
MHHWRVFAVLWAALLPCGGCSGMLTRSTVPELSDGIPAKRVCYLQASEFLQPESLDVTVCTHIICGFADLADGTLAPRRPEDAAYYVRTTALKRVNPSLKVMLSVGGGGSSGLKFTDMVSTNEARTRFLNSAILFLRKYGFDGLDIDWEFPGQSDPPELDRGNFVHLLKEAREQFQNESIVTKQPALLLSVAVSASEPIIVKSYDAPGIGRYVDFVNLMCYDYHMFQIYMPFTGHNSPLFKRKVESAIFSTLNTAWSAEYWVQIGVPREKIVVGIPTYGRTYTLADPTHHGLDAPAVGDGPEQGSVSYSWVCDFLRGGATRAFDDESQVLYAFQNVTWVGYDDFISIRSKVVWIKARNFGGIMTFSLNNDDAEGTCGEGKFPLHSMIRNMLT